MGRPCGTERGPGRWRPSALRPDRSPRRWPRPSHRRPAVGRRVRRASGVTGAERCGDTRARSRCRRNPASVELQALHRPTDRFVLIGPVPWHTWDESEPTRASATMAAPSLTWSIVAADQRLVTGPDDALGCLAVLARRLLRRCYREQVAAPAPSARQVRAGGRAVSRSRPWTPWARSQ